MNKVIYLKPYCVEFQVGAYLSWKTNKSDRKSSQALSYCPTKISMYIYICLKNNRIFSHSVHQKKFVSVLLENDN